MTGSFEAYMQAVTALFPQPKAHFNVDTHMWIIFSADPRTDSAAKELGVGRDLFTAWRSASTFELAKNVLVH